jgi:spermidine/putrescine transport system substrate-binding protein
VGLSIDTNPLEYAQEEHVMKRYRLIGLVGALVAGLAMAGCGAATPPPTEAPAATAAASNDTELNVYNWSTYIAPDMIPAFEKLYGVKVNYDLFSDNDELLAKIQPGNPGYDIIVPTDYMVTNMINQNLLETLDKSKLSNFKNIDPAFLNPPYDPNNDHCVPYQWGTVGLGYNKKALGKDIDSWDVMFNGEYSGRISWLTEARDVMGIALIYQGHDPNTTNPDEIASARDLLIKTKKDVKAFAPDTGQDLLNQGDVDIAFEYSGDIFQIMAGSDTSPGNPDINYVIPKEGAILWTDNLCIPTGAPHPDLAHKFIDFILDAQNGADLSNYTAYGTPNIASLPLITDDLRNNPGIYPSDEVKKHLFFIKSLGANDKLYDDAWTALGVGQ